MSLSRAFKRMLNYFVMQTGGNLGYHVWKASVVPCLGHGMSNRKEEEEEAEEEERDVFTCITLWNPHYFM